MGLENQLKSLRDFEYDMDLEDYKILGDAGKYYWWFTGKRELIEMLLSKMAYNDKIKILDVGCGTGEDIPLYNKFGDIYAMDNSRECLLHVPKKDTTAVICNDIQKLCFKENTFDVVIISEVLEHLENDKSAIEETTRVLKKRGFIIITVPAIPSIYSHTDRAIRHLRRYSKKRLVGLFNTKTLTTRKIIYWNFLLSFPRILLNPIIVKSKFGRWIYRLRELPKFLNLFLVTILRFENKIIDYGINLPIGLSLIAVLEKK